MTMLQKNLFGIFFLGVNDDECISILTVTNMIANVTKNIEQLKIDQQNIVSLDCLGMWR